jgi:hypothetical protein
MRVRRPHLTFIGVALLGAAPLLVATGCKPNLGDPPSVVAGPRILTVRGTPAEAAPNDPVVYDVLAVDVTGQITPPPVSWATCNKPKPPAEANAVSSECLGMIPEETPPQPTYMAMMPAKACKQFGPQPPDVERGQPPVRPRDPDVTGGFYQPVRAVLQVDSQVDSDPIAFALERIKCGLSNAPNDITGTFNMTYKANVNPKIAAVSLDPDGDPAPLFPPQQLAWVGAGGATTFEVSWTPETPESYPVYDPGTQMIDTHREALSVSWYATAGAFDHDRTGRGESEPELATQNRWAPPAVAGPAPLVVHFWVVLRDSRGGVDFTGFDLEVRP